MRPSWSRLLTGSPRWDTWALVGARVLAGLCFAAQVGLILLAMVAVGMYPQDAASTAGPLLMIGMAVMGGALILVLWPHGRAASLLAILGIVIWLAVMLVTEPNEWEEALMAIAPAALGAVFGWPVKAPPPPETIS